MQLSLSARRRGLIALLATTFLMYGGFFMVIPLVSVVYVEQLGFAAATVGLSLALRQLLQQGLTLGGGMLADMFGVRALIGVGVLVRAAGFVSLAYAGTPALLFLAMALSAFGGALFDAPSRAAMAALTDEAERARYFSLNGVASGLGMTIGPLVGAMLLRLNFQTVALAAAACFVAVFGFVLLLPAVKVAQGQQTVGYGLSLALRDRTFLIFTGLLMGYWFMWVQLTLSLPLAAERLTGSSDAVGAVYALNAGLTVLFQYPVLGLAERHLRPMPILIIGVALMALGLGLVAAAGSVLVLAACVVIFTLGTLLATPTQQSVTAALADERALGSYFGVNALALAFGGSLGNSAGGLMTDAARAIGQPALPWLTFALVGLGSAIGMAMLARALQRRQATVHLVRGAPGKL
ncbi:MAG: MFS transporter [Chloroflexales bacterium]|nr:MFS transporter [Chloroflexales bacterium]